MRYLQRMQTGLALAAVVFLLSSAVVTLQARGKSTAAVGAPAATFASLCHSQFNRDVSVRVSSYAGQSASSAFLETRAKAGCFRTITKLVDDAVLMPEGSDQPFPYQLVFYRQDGAVDRIVRASADGMVMDPATGLCFRAGEALVQTMASVMKTER